MWRVMVALCGVFMVAVTVALSVGQALPPGEQLLYVSMQPGRYGQRRIYLYDSSQGVSANLGLTNVAAMKPAWSGDGRKLAYIQLLPDGGLGLSIFDLTTGTSTPINAPFPSSEPDWSPDGKRLAYRAGGHEIVIYDFMTQMSFMVYPITPVHSLPLWLADGKSLAYISNANGISRPYIVSDQCRYEDFDCLGAGLERQIANDETYWSITRSPDYRRFAMSIRDGEIYRWRLDFITLDCENVFDDSCVQITQSYSERLPHSVEAIWSPDGKYVAFAMNSQTRRQLHVLDVTTEVHRQLASDLVPLANLAWSPSGTQIAVPMDTQSTKQIILVDTESGALRARIGIRQSVYSPLWRPGSNW